MSSPIVILSATAPEQQPVVDALLDADRNDSFGRQRVTGHLADRTMCLVETGIGAVNTAHALTCVLESGRPSLVLMTGIGGAFPGTDLGIGDLALATEEIYGDLGIAGPEGWQSADAIGIPVVSGDPPRYNHFPLDASHVDSAGRSLRDFASAAGVAFASGPFVTVQQVTGRDDLARELVARFGALCENMEGAAAAHICALYRVPFLEVRGISNRVERRDRDAWDVPRAIDVAGRAVVHLLRQPDALLD